jgi:nucleotide-binding universal stress UspA family protein
MKVLYGTDGGRPAAQALSLLERTVTPDKTEVTVVTVVGPGDAETVSLDDEMPDVGSPTAILRLAQERLEAGGFEVDGKVLQGRPGARILEEIDEGGFELTVVGAGNRSRLGRLLLGSVSTKVLHASPTSVLVVHRVSERAGSNRVLFGTDGSADANVALAQITALFDPTSCQIKVLTVAEHLMPKISFPIPRLAYATAAPTPEQEEEWMAAALEPAEQSAEKLRAAGFRAEAEAVLGAPAQHLLADADKMKADIVVVGTRGLGAVERAVIGSVSDQVVREAPATIVARGARLPHHGGSR